MVISHTYSWGAYQNGIFSGLDVPRIFLGWGRLFRLVVLGIAWRVVAFSDFAEIVRGNRSFCFYNFCLTNYFLLRISINYFSLKYLNFTFFVRIFLTYYFFCYNFLDKLFFGEILLQIIFCYNFLDKIFGFKHFLSNWDRSSLVDCRFLSGSPNFYYHFRIPVFILISLATDL